MQGRDQLEGTPSGKEPGQTQRWCALPPNLQRVKQAVERDCQTQFTALLHHLDESSLRRSFAGLKRRAAPGVDGETVASYERDLDANLAALAVRVQSNRYRPSPVLRKRIRKPDGGERLLGIPVLEDKIVQGAVVELLNVIYEKEFFNFSYGFRPGRSPHDALSVLNKMIMAEKVNWVLDADIRSFFDSVDHESLLRALALKIADPRLLRLITLWLRAGVMESGEWHETTEGTPQGGVISPLLANIYLHYALDRWVVDWGRQRGPGLVRMVRFADDFVICFQYEADARAMLVALAERLGQCHLQLHPDKTRVLEFGRFATANRAQRGQRRPETFDFLGFRHYCGKTRNGRFVLKRKTRPDRLRRKIREVRQQLRRRMHEPVRKQHRWLCSVLTGHYNYFGVSHNYRCIDNFYYAILLIWKKTLGRRGQKKRLTWEQYNDLLRVFALPKPRITHPWQSA